MAARWLLAFWTCLFLFHCAAEEEQWTVERFSGSLPGNTVTVTRALWSGGALEESGRDEPPRPELAYALRCAQAANGSIAGAELLRAEGWEAEIRPQAPETRLWLRENAWRFGLLPVETGGYLRLRYVGQAHAAAMRALDMSLEEYLRFLRREGGIRLGRKGEAYAWIFCLPEGEALSFALPPGAAWEISGDGAGCAVLAIRSGS